MLAGTARFCFNLFGFYFADSVCTAIDLPSASRNSGCLPSVTHSLVTTTFFACSKDDILSMHKTGNPCEHLQELPVFVSICLHFTLRILPARQSACPLHPQFPAACPWCLGCSDFFACSKDNTLSIQKTGSPCECLQELPVSVLICLGFTLQILPAQQSACPLHLKFPAACPLSHIPWSQRLFSPAPKMARHTWSVPKCFP